MIAAGPLAVVLNSLLTGSLPVPVFFNYFYGFLFVYFFYCIKSRSLLPCPTASGSVPRSGSIIRTLYGYAVLHLMYWHNHDLPMAT